MRLKQRGGESAKNTQGSGVTILRAAQADAESLAQLTTQLGYPSSAEDITRRLTRLQLDENQAVFVAVGEDGKVKGWVHVFGSSLVEGDPEAEVGGLVVDEAYRRTGVGRLLLNRAEEWACEKGLKSVYLRSNIIRKDAHVFYQSLGYTIIKTQYAFRKFL